MREGKVDAAGSGGAHCECPNSRAYRRIAGQRIQMSGNRPTRTWGNIRRKLGVSFESPAGNPYRVASRVLRVGKFKAIRFVNNGELQPLFFFGAFESPDIVDSKNKLHGGTTFLRHTGLVQRDCATACGTGQFQPTICAAWKRKQAKEALVKSGDLRDIPNVENDTSDSRWTHDRKVFHAVKMYKTAR